MSNIVSAARSSVGKKIITGLTGLGLVGFVIVHLLGNLTLFLGHNGQAFNEYAHFLESLGHGWLLPVAEVSLFLLFLIHIVSAISVSVRNRQARPLGYVRVADAGHTSRKTPSSKTMIWTGLILMAFTIFHVFQFRIANISNHHLVDYPGMPGVRQLYGLVHDAFSSWLYVALYCAVMLLLGLHLRHGAWSAWQSIGLNNRRWMPFFYAASVVLALLIAVGFFLLPIYVHFAPAIVTGGPQ
jgi:succinate dehydrogenase / fumarate reductase cytochrome b subunit